MVCGAPDLDDNKVGRGGRGFSDKTAASSSTSSRNPFQTPSSSGIERLVFIARIDARWLSLSRTKGVEEKEATLGLAPGPTLALNEACCCNRFDGRI